jgi:hypothetical protein
MNPDLRSFLDGANECHARQPRHFADELLARASALPADEAGAEAVRWAEHVMLGHLADADALRRFLESLRHPSSAGAAWLEACARTQWALAAVSATMSTTQVDARSAAELAAPEAEPPSAPTLSDAARWRALQNVVLALAWSGRTNEASARLRQDEAAATSHPDADARRAYAACANNVAQGLRDGPRGDCERDALMLEAATVARRAWAHAGNWLHVERADYQLARCHALLGHGAEALCAAHACQAACMAHGADADECFFAHEALWHAHRAGGDEVAATAERAHMQSLLADIADAEMHAWCAQAIAEINAIDGSRP